MLLADRKLDLIFFLIVAAVDCMVLAWQCLSDVLQWTVTLL